MPAPVIYYYDFAIGHPHTDRTTWRDNRLRIPAKNLQTAIEIYCLFADISIASIWYRLRSATEFLRVKEKGRLHLMYQENRAISEAEIHSLFG